MLTFTGARGEYRGGGGPGVQDPQTSLRGEKTSLTCTRMAYIVVLKSCADAPPSFRNPVSAPACLPACLPACVCLCLSVSACMSVCLSVCLYVCLDVWMSGCLDVWMSGCLDVWRQRLRIQGEHMKRERGYTPTESELMSTKVWSHPIYT